MTKAMCLRLAMALLPALLLAACDESKPLKSVDLKLNWQHGADFLGFYVAVKRDYFAQEGLEVNIHPLSDPKEFKQVFDRVVADDFEFSTAGESLIEAQARGLPLVAIANIVKFNPGTLFAKKETGIVTPADLVGMRIAVKNESWRGSIGKLLKQFDLTLADVVEVPSGFDMRPFYEGEVDVWGGFIQDEPVRARIAGLDIVTLPFYEYGLGGIALTVFTSRALLDSDPDLSVRFTRASLRGWRWAVENPTEAVDLMLELHPGMKPEREFHLASFRASIPLLLPPGAELGAIDCASWRSHELLAELPSRESICTTKIYEAARRESGQ